MAFLPAPPPPHLTYDTDLVLALSRADAALSELAGVGRLVPNPHLLISPYMRREAVLSSRIEGTRASLSDLLLEEAGAVTDQRHAADILEVRNYRVRTHGDWSAWLHFFLSGVAETAQAAMRQASSLMDLRETYRGRLLKAPKALALLDALFVNPYITVARAAQLLHVSAPTARAAVLALQEQGILEETTGGAWRRMYLAAPILHAVESPPPA